MTKKLVTFKSIILGVMAMVAAWMPLESVNAQNPTENNMGAYLFVFHQDATSSLYMATSRDGYSFTAVNNAQPVMRGDTLATQKGIRDPHIYRGPDGAFYLSMTDLHISAKQMGFRTTQWERDAKQYGWGNNHGFVLMKATNFVSPKHGAIIPITLEEAERLEKYWK